MTVQTNIKNVETMTGAGTGLAPQASVTDKLIRAGLQKRQGAIDEAQKLLEAAMVDARATPYSIEFETRIRLATTLADHYLETGDQSRAAELLSEEIAFAQTIAEIIGATGAPDQKRTANAGLLQLRDRAAQIALIGTTAPSIAVAEWIRGGASLEELRGRVVMLEFWATWCKPCREMFPKLRQLSETYGSKGLEVMALTRFYQSHTSAADSRSQELALIRQTVTEHSLDFHVGVMEDETAQATYGGNGLPTLIIIDRKGTVHWAGHPAENAQIEALLSQLLLESS